MRGGACRRITSATSATLYTRAKLHNTSLNPARYIYSQINNTALLCRAKSPKFPKFCVFAGEFHQHSGVKIRWACMRMQ